jgi:hypothetical protein
MKLSHLFANAEKGRGIETGITPYRKPPEKLANELGK